MKRLTTDTLDGSFESINAVKNATGCDNWIAKKALADTNHCVQSAIGLVQERMSYQTSTCRCGELVAGKWSYCPYCGTKKREREAGSDVR